MCLMVTYRNIMNRIMLLLIYIFVVVGLNVIPVSYLHTINTKTQKVKLTINRLGLYEMT